MKLKNIIAVGTVVTGYLLMQMRVRRCGPEGERWFVHFALSKSVAANSEKEKASFGLFIELSSSLAQTSEKQLNNQIFFRKISTG